MEAILLIDDHILVNRFIYKITDIKRNDIIVFKFPHDNDYPDTSGLYKNIFLTPIYFNAGFTNIKNMFKYYRPRDFIKRAIGLPGETFEMINKEVYINNQIQKLESAIHSSDQTLVERDFFGPVKIPKKNDVLRFKELNLYELFCIDNYFKYKGIAFSYKFKLIVDGIEQTKVNTIYGEQPVDTLNFKQLAIFNFLFQKKHSVNFEIFDIKIAGVSADSYTITEDCYMALGDNRDNSSDSRFWGYVPETLIKGKPLIIYWPLTRIRII